MKTTGILLFLALGQFFMQADALKCRQSSCVGTKPCSSITTTCRDGLDHCFLMTSSTPLFTMARGCITESNCAILKAHNPNTLCCKRDLCN
ncbi:hypothetical protein GDO78_021131 [Eleutherodactylus coqui]|uniref:Uncharacterized protein n=1 Tax=Eleutherodactylus coqui TaxID=57060 RepID=A0A8J6EHL6_ELECQ|nr:hypothetical protein GDO78_021131 [Eleutherodactylus coqui]